MAESSNLFNNIVTPGFVEPIEDRGTIDLVKSGEAQLREVMKASYEPNKLKTQIEFNAICLSQLEPILMGDQTIVRVKARIPELHSILPIPENNEDYNTIALYPTFQAAASDFGFLAGFAQGGIIPGTKLVVSFDQMGNFSEGTLQKVFSWKMNSSEASWWSQKDSNTNVSRKEENKDTSTPDTNRAKSRNEAKLIKKYANVTDKLVQDALIESWYDLVLDLTANKKGEGALLPSTEDRNLKKVGVKTKWDTGGQGKWVYPKLRKGWGAKCLQFASALMQLTNDKLNRPGGLLPYFMTGAFEIPDSMLPSGQKTGKGSWACKLKKVKTESNNRYFGAGNNLKDLGKLGILPGMLVHVSVNWDEKISSCYGTLNDAFHHWLVYVGYFNGKHYYCDSRGIKTASQYDSWLRNWWVKKQYEKIKCPIPPKKDFNGTKEEYEEYKKNIKEQNPGCIKWDFQPLRDYISKKYGQSIQRYSDFEEVDKYSATSLVRHVHSAFPLIADPTKVKFETVEKEKHKTTPATKQPIGPQKL